jgi:hypothetical protein
MKAEHATWETGLVIPESTKPIPEQTLDALLRIEELLTKLVRAKGLEALAEFDSEELQEIQQVRETTKPPKGKRNTNGK